MKIMYAVMPTGEPVRSIDDGALAARQAVKITLKNLKRWCAKLRRGKTARIVDFKSDRTNCPNEIKVHRCNAMITKTMIVEEEESRNRTNENLENELRESLASNNQSRMHGIVGDNCECQPGGQQSERR